MLGRGTLGLVPDNGSRSDPDHGRGSRAWSRPDRVGWF